MVQSGVCGHVLHDGYASMDVLWYREVRVFGLTGDPVAEVKVNGQRSLQFRYDAVLKVRVPP